jgi:hypothetical protein
MRREIVLREINQGALAGMSSDITAYAAQLVLDALDRYDTWSASREAPNPTARPCPFCPDGHPDPRKRHWGVYVGPERDSDGQPTTLHVMISNGAHVAGSDADWLWKVIREL